MDSDKALELMGDWSRWKLGLYALCSCFCGFLGGWHMLAIVFVGMEPEHHCWIPDGVPINRSIPDIINEGVTSRDKCHTFQNYSAATNQTVDCPNGWEFPDQHLHTIVNEWNLVCGRGYLVETSQTILVAGVMVGAMLMTSLADKCGRKMVFIGSILGISFVGFLTSFVNNYIAFAFFRFCTGVFQQGVVLAGFVYIIELFPASQRTVMGLVMQCCWALGMGIIALFAWLWPNWRHVLLTISVPGFLGIVLFWIVPESVPWLCATDRLSEARQVLTTAYRVTKRPMPAEFRLTEADKEKLAQEKKKGFVTRVKESLVSCCKRGGGGRQKASYSIMDILRSRKLLGFAVIMAYLWCANSLIYYGLSLSTGSLAGNVYLNFFLSGLVEIPAYFIAAFALKYIGRRWSIFAFHIVAGVPLFLTLFIPVQTAGGTDLSGLITALSMIGKFGITGSFGSVFLYAPELFPTTVRNIGIGIASVGGRLGNIIAPFSSFVAKRVWWLPNVVFGLMSIVAALLTLILPETLNRPLPETVQDVEGWSRTLTKAEKLQYKADQKAMEELKDLNENGRAEEGLREPLQTKSDIPT